MKKFVLIALMVFLPTLLYGQVFIQEDFSGTFPPSGWTVDSHSSNWYTATSTNAGGAAPELVFDWSPQFSGTSRLISPEIDLTGVTALNVRFRHMLDHYSGAYTIGVATRSGGGAWNTVWQTVNPSGNINATTVTSAITNGDVGAADFQICWFFSGDSYNLDYWYLDDLLLYQSYEHDMMVGNILMDDQYDANDDIIPMAMVTNFGLSDETTDVECNIALGTDVVYSETATDIFVRAGQNSTVSFPAFVTAMENELYNVTVTTMLDGDMNHDNDSQSKWFNTYTTEREMVVLEIGTGCWCTYCPGAQMGAHDLVQNGHDVAVVEYHNNDAFTNTYSDARNNYYGISGFPTAVFDGVEKFIGGDHSNSMYSYYLPIYQGRKPINSAFTMEIHGENDGNDYHVVVSVHKMATIAWENMVLHLALTESDINYSWQGQTQVHYAERLMAPDQYGTTLDFSSTDNIDVDLNFSVDPSWAVENCEITSFIQNLDDKEILQGTKVALDALTPLAIGDDRVAIPTETRLTGNYPNPFNANTLINFSLKQTGNVDLEIYNVMGQKVRTLANEIFEAGQHSVVWDGRSDNGAVVSSGVYFYKLTSADYSGTRKMLLAK